VLGLRRFRRQSISPATCTVQIPRITVEVLHHLATLVYTQAATAAGVGPADGGEVVRRDDAVGVEENEIRTVGGTHPDVARVAAAGVGLDDVVDHEAGAEGFPLGRAGPGGAILYEHQFKVPIGLCGEAFEQFAGFVRAVIDGDDDGEEGRRVHFTSLSSWIRRGHLPQRSITQRT